MHEARQRMLEYIDQHVAKHGYAPTVREIGAAVGITSTSTVQHHLNALERAGEIERGHDPGSHSGPSRAIRRRGSRLVRRGDRVVVELDGQHVEASFVR